MLSSNSEHTQQNVLFFILLIQTLLVALGQIGITSGFSQNKRYCPLIQLNEKVTHYVTL